MPVITFVTFGADFFSSVSFFSDEESVTSSTSIAARGGIKLSLSSLVNFNVDFVKGTHLLLWTLQYCWAYYHLNGTHQLRID